MLIPHHYKLIVGYGKTVALFINRLDALQALYLLQRNNPEDAFDILAFDDSNILIGSIFNDFNKEK